MGELGPGKAPGLRASFGTRFTAWNRLSPSTDGSQPCRLSDFCRTLMTKPGCSGYCLSHQLLFFLSARMVSAWGGPGHTLRRRKIKAVWFCMLHTGKISGFLDRCFEHQEGEVRVAYHPMAIKCNRTGWGCGFKILLDRELCMLNRIVGHPKTKRESKRCSRKNLVNTNKWKRT